MRSPTRSTVDTLVEIIDPTVLISVPAVLFVQHDLPLGNDAVKRTLYLDKGCVAFPCEPRNEENASRRDNAGDTEHPVDESRKAIAVTPVDARHVICPLTWHDLMIYADVVIDIWILLAIKFFPHDGAVADIIDVGLVYGVFHGGDLGFDLGELLTCAGVESG